MKIANAVFIASWSEFKSWSSEKKRKPESALSQVEQQKSQHVQQLVGGTPHLWSEAARWSEASSELREQAVQVFQLQVRLLGTFSVVNINDVWLTLLLNPTVREGDLSDRLHHARSTVSWSALVDRAHGAVRERVASYSMS